MEMNAQQLFNQIQQLEFICVDLNEYLDTHPDDEMALCEYNFYGKELRRLKREYAQVCGPIQNFGNAEADGPSFNWLQSPWPWEA